MIVFEGSIFDGLKLISLSALGNISVVVTHHFVEEGFGLIGSGFSHAIILNNIDNSDALIVKLLLNLFLVSSKTFIELGVFWVLLDGADGPDGSSLGANLVLESNREKVSLFSGEIF